MSPGLMRSGYFPDGQPVSIEELEAAHRLRDVLHEFGCLLPLDKSLEAYRKLSKPIIMDQSDIDDIDDVEGRRGRRSLTQT